MKRLVIATCSVAALAVSMLTGIGVASSTESTVIGKATIGGQPVVGATVTTWIAGNSPGSATVVDTATTAAKGGFRTDVSDRNIGDVMYVQVSGGNLSARLTLMAVIEPGQDRVYLNELTTVASAYGLAQFLARDAVGGTNPGLTNAASMVGNLVESATGEVSSFLASAPNGNQTQTLATVNSLANILVRCNESPVVCRRLARFTDGSKTVQSLANLAKDPARNVKRIFGLSTGTNANAPALSEANNSWILALKFTGNGRQFNAPGNFVFDAEGSLWVGNNYVPSDNPIAVCAGRAVLKLQPYAAGQPVTEYRGGGVSGVGFGITFDRDDNVWVSNYGFKGSECPETPPSNSLSQFTLQGEPLSPDVTGFTEGPLSWPQGMARNDAGDIFTASCGNDSLVVYRDADPARSVALTDNGLAKPFDVDIDSAGNSWVTNVRGNGVSAFAPDGSPLTGSPFVDGQLKRPLGIAIDSNDSKWVANSVVIAIPCGDSSGSSAPVITDEQPTVRPRITHIDAAGNARDYSGGGLTIPWGVAIDGDDQVWVANFQGDRVSRFCGTEAQTCPRGLTTGDNISGKTGYGFDGLQRNTGVGIDHAGNVWLANNWKAVPIQSNPGGDGMVVLVGAGAPVS